MPKPLPDRIAALKARQEKTAAKISALQARAGIEARKRDTRRKIVVGGAVLLAMEKDQALAATVRNLLARHVGRPIDRDVVADLLFPSPASAAAAFSPAAERIAS